MSAVEWTDEENRWDTDPADLVTVADLADVPIWRYEPPAEECDHPVTVTKRLDITQPIPGDPDNVRVIGQTTHRVTVCLDCHHGPLVPRDVPHPDDQEDQ